MYVRLILSNAQPPRRFIDNASVPADLQMQPVWITLEARDRRCSINFFVSSTTCSSPSSSLFLATTSTSRMDVY